MPNRKYITVPGQRIGRLTIIREIYLIKKGYKQRYAECICDCGNKVTPRVTSLFDGNTISCGCVQSEIGFNSFKHGQCSTPLYYVFTCMKNRCYRKELPDYKNYGARGITICNEWTHDFMLFYNWAMANGYKKGLTIDRIDNNKGYFPENCQFVSRQIQCNNKRTNHLIEYNNEKLSMMDFCRKYNLSYSLFQRRISVLKLPLSEAILNCGTYQKRIWANYRYSKNQ